MDDLELSCSLAVNVLDRRPPVECSLEDMRWFNFKKSLDLTIAVTDIRRALHARLAASFSISPQDRSGNADTVDLSSLVVTDITDLVP